MATSEKPTAVDRGIEFVPFMAKDSIRLTVGMVKTMLCKPTKKGFAPTDADAMKFIMLCKARGLNPFEGDAFLVGYDSEKTGPEFSLITAHQTFLKRAETHPEYDGMDSGVIVRDKAGAIVDREGDFYLEDDVLLGGWAAVYFKARKRPKKARLKLATFCKDTKFWRDNPGGMICKCAEADALRGSFPNQLGGMYLADELPAIDVASKPSAPGPTSLDALSDRLMAKAAARAAKDTPAEQGNAAAPEDNPRDEEQPTEEEYEASQQAPPDEHSQAVDPLEEFLEALPAAKHTLAINALVNAECAKWDKEPDMRDRIRAFGKQAIASVKATTGPGSNRQRTLGGAEGGA